MMSLSMLSLKHLLLYYSMLCCIKGQIANPFRIEVINVTMRSGNKANVALQIINTNSSFLSEPIRLRLTIFNQTFTKDYLNITTLGGSISSFSKDITNLEQDQQYTVTLSAIQRNSHRPLEPQRISNTFMTTNLQSISINDNPQNCQMTVSCHFALGSRATGCNVNIESMTSNASSIERLVISRHGEAAQIASRVLTGVEYLSLAGDMYEAEGYGIRDDQRLDSLEVSTEFELTGNIAMDRCTNDGTPSEDSLFLKIGVPIIATVIAGMILLILLMLVVVLIVRKKRNGKEKIVSKKSSLDNSNKKELISNIEKREGSDEREGESDSPQPQYVEVLPEDSESLNGSASSSPRPHPHRKEKEVKKREQDDDENDDAYENVEDYLTPVPLHSTNKKREESNSTVKGNGKEEEEDQNMYVNVGASNGKRRGNVSQLKPVTQNIQRESVPDSSSRDDEEEYMEMIANPSRETNDSLYQ